MQQRAHRGRRHHGRGQPGVEGHDGGLGETAQVTEIDRAQQQARGVDAVEQAGGFEIEGAGHLVSERQPGQQEGLGSPHQVDQVAPAAVPGFLVLLVVDQGIGDQAERLVEDDQGEQVGGEGPADGRRQADGETGEEAGLGVLLQAPHVADAVDRGDDPQQGRYGGEHHAQGIHPEGEIHPRQYLEQGDLDGPAREHHGRHGYDDQELDQGRHQGDRVPEVVSTVEPEDGARGQQGHGEGEDGLDRGDGFQPIILS